MTSTVEWKKRLVKTLLGFLSQGLSTKELALTLALGVTLGTIPVIGITTIACSLVAVALKLNIPVIQFVNYVAYPLQLVLMVPYFYLGNLIFGARKTLDTAMTANIFSAGDYKEAIMILIDATFYAVGAWLVISPILFAFLYIGLKPVLLRINNATSRFRSSRNHR
jgi:hypothetical protein